MGVDTGMTLLCAPRGAPAPLDGWPDLRLRDGMHMALRARAAQLYLDGVFDTRRLAMAAGTAPPFVGTRWKCIELPGTPGLWRLACQNDDDYCLGADAPDLRLEKSDPDHVPKALQWLLFRRGGHMMIRSKGGDWLGVKKGAAFCAPLDDLDDPHHHWLPERYW